MSAPTMSQTRIVDAEFVAAAGTFEQLPPPQYPEIAFAGRSNVGKSTLMNAIMGRRKLVRTSSTPGCTRTVSFFHATTADKTHVMLVDLPGYGYAQRSHTERKGWARLIEGYLLKRSNLRAVVLLIDARRDATAADLELIEMLKLTDTETRVPAGVVLVATKLDEVPSSQRASRVRLLRQQTSQKVHGLSALDAPSVAALWQDLCGKWLAEPPSPRY
jgi:GTP-binding protein